MRRGPYDGVVYASLTGLIARRPRLVLIAWVAAAIAMYSLATVGVGGGNLFDRASTRLPTAQGADSTKVYEFQLAHPSETTGPLLSAEFTGISPEDASLVQPVTALADELAARPGVIAVMWPQGVIPGPEVSQGAGRRVGDPRHAREF